MADFRQKRRQGKPIGRPKGVPNAPDRGDREIKKLVRSNVPGTYRVSANLFLVITTTARALWQFRWHPTPGSRRKHNFGSYPAMPLAEARSRVHTALQNVKAGREAATPAASHTFPTP